MVDSTKQIVFPGKYFTFLSQMKVFLMKIYIFSLISKNAVPLKHQETASFLCDLESFEDHIFRTLVTG